ncbi:alpha/beta hydrolase [Rhizobium sp. CF142]|uniref:alpha/beta hydrolase n=1 Tax=Rhizobium sp. CF142 TaxID=1144314 RepID=UPI00026EEC24|nr:alpha/beta hydrolase [Rhizobium sp. CF142]EJJ26703.1 esterase/lipase [Rhizobium sp. CF142]
MTFDRTTLDQDYNVGLAVPGWQTLLARWTADSAVARQTIVHVADLSYGAHPRERIDYFGSAEGGPVIAFFHGGYWQGREKSEYACVAAPYVAKGYDVAILEYPIVPDVMFALVIESCRRAVAWLSGYVEERRQRPAGIFLLGHSAGGHLASMVAVADWQRFGLSASPVAGLCSVSGIYELEPVASSFVNKALKLSPTDCADLSPARFAPIGDFPCLFGVGSSDTPAFLWQQDEVLRGWSGKSAVEGLVLEGDDHFSILDAVAYRDGAMMGKLLGLLAGIRDGLG